MGGVTEATRAARQRLLFRRRARPVAVEQLELPFDGPELDHKYHDAGLSVLCVKPGFVRTAMTAGLKPPPLGGEVERVASEVVRAIDRRRAVLYTPRIWAHVMLVIRWLPRIVTRKLAF